MIDVSCAINSNIADSNIELLEWVKNNYKCDIKYLTLTYSNKVNKWLLKNGHPINSNSIEVLII
jgi:hypothetical protein